MRGPPWLTLCPYVGGPSFSPKEYNDWCRVKVSIYYYIPPNKVTVGLIRTADQMIVTHIIIKHNINPLLLARVLSYSSVWVSPSLGS